ncbi:MAG TPA: M20/M25/M40 family metallo-hydrolase [Rhodanobacteraceae bacterium]|nr:M20/M25/M40 family metallo-hydrolase [Rhodanobacteraceae bacterium]
MNALLESTLQHLENLVGFDTRNPPRVIGTDGIFDYLRTQLPDFDITVTDHGAGAVSMLAVRGQPRLLFNVHLDTVPAAPAWSRDPHQLLVTGECAIGLGACDIKGAAAGLLAVAQATERPMAMLFSTDEEANDARCIQAFLKAFPPLPSGEGRGEGTFGAKGSGQTEPSPPAPLPEGEGSFEAVIVAEPTQARAVLAHRGIQSAYVHFHGRAGHASADQKPGDSALHQAVEWSHAALGFVAAQANHSFGGLHGLRFNIGRIEGGIKANVIAPEAELRFNMRPLPDMDPDGLLTQFRDMALPGTHLQETFRGPALPAGDPAQTEARWHEARALAGELGFPIGNAVDFWTEAAKFSAAGYTTFVYGPGDIAQAHSADEWVALEQLADYAASIHRVVEAGQA